MYEMMTVALKEMGTILIPSIGDRAVIKFRLWVVIMPVCVSSLPSQICLWAHCLTSSGLSNDVIHLCSLGNIRSKLERRWWTLLWTCSLPLTFVFMCASFTDLGLICYFIHLYCCFSVSVCPSLVTDGLCCFDFYVGNLTVTASVFIVPLEFMVPQVSTATLMNFGRENFQTLRYTHCTRHISTIECNPAQHLCHEFYFYKAILLLLRDVSSVLPLSFMQTAGPKHLLKKRLLI